MTATTLINSSAYLPEAPITRVIKTFQEWLHLPDPAPVEVVLGAVAANLMPGDPAWLMLVGAPGSGKTEILNSLSHLPDIHTAATITEGALLSGTAKGQRAEGASGGLLKKIGRFGILVCKDFTSILSMHRDGRSAMLAALREIYDGHWVRHLGVDGGTTLSWQGKLGLIAACTGTIDSHHAVMASMGERFCLYRLPPVDEQAQAERALSHIGHEKTMRSELLAAVANLFSHVNIPKEPPPLDAAERDRVIALAALAVRCRSAVERDGYTREITAVPDPEAPARLALVLTRLLAGMTVIGVSSDEAWRVVVKVGLDCMPAIRRRIFDHLVDGGPTEGGGTAADTADIANAVAWPKGTVRRALEDLAAHSVVRKLPGKNADGDRWTLSDWAKTQYAAALRTVPEKSAAAEARAVPEMSVEDSGGVPEMSLGDL